MTELKLTEKFATDGIPHHLALDLDIVRALVTTDDQQQSDGSGPGAGSVWSVASPLAACPSSVLRCAGSGRCCARPTLINLEVAVSAREGALTSLARPRLVATSPTADTLTRRGAAPMSARIPLDYPAIAAFCRRWGVSELALFGSVLRDDFRPDSDVDVLVTFAPEVWPSLDDLLSMQDELAALFGRSVDLLERRALEHDRNYLLRRHVFEHLEPVYVASMSRG